MLPASPNNAYDLSSQFESVKAYALRIGKSEKSVINSYHKKKLIGYRYGKRIYISKQGSELEVNNA